MISAVLDTNVLASGTISAFTPPGQLLDAWHVGEYQLVTSEHILRELEHVFQKPYFQKHVNPTKVSGFIDLLRNEALLVPITVSIQGVATHPEDDLTIATAVSAKADFLVTGDAPLINKVGKEYQGIKLLTPGDFLKKL